MEYCLKKTCWGEDKEDIQNDAIAIELHDELPYILKSEVSYTYMESSSSDQFTCRARTAYTFFRERQIGLLTVCFPISFLQDAMCTLYTNFNEGKRTKTWTLTDYEKNHPKCKNDKAKYKTNID